MLVVKYSLNNLNNTLVLPASPSLLGVGCRESKDGKEQPYAKVGFTRSTPMFQSTNRHHYRVNQLPEASFVNVRIVLVPMEESKDSVLGYHTTLDYNEATHQLISLGSLSYRSREYDSYAVVGYTQDEDENIITSNIVSRQGSQVDESRLIRRI